MLKLNRTTEYGLLALTYIRNKEANKKEDRSITSAREIAQFYQLPFEILAKTLQRLKEQGVIASTYGTRGGYVLSKDLSKLSLTEFLTIMEGSSGVVGCVQSTGEATAAEHQCEYSGLCSIKTMMNTLNKRVYDFLSDITIEELTRKISHQNSFSTASSAQVAGVEHAFTMNLQHGEEP